MNRKFLSFAVLFGLSILAASCDWIGSVSESARFDATFNLATAGNMLNLNYSNPEIGPEGYVSYKSYFRKCAIVLDYDEKIVFSYELTDGNGTTKEGTYTSKTPEKGNVLLADYGGEVLSYDWPNYFEFYITETYDFPTLGETEVTILFHAAVIFSQSERLS